MLPAQQSRLAKPRYHFRGASALFVVLERVCKFKQQQVFVVLICTGQSECDAWVGHLGRAAARAPLDESSQSEGSKVLAPPCACEAMQQELIELYLSC